ncbi:flagellar hook capping FlgD N-terminal domain-containing protein [Thermomonas sp.]|uniref:flagellar hook assembly protein FlgD n=1 Tax=Thermomonas sp. TaxID=1971895 RepID=UPI002D1DC121|nr:flagellar hook capping FlgD N-terminal domain-containing protein [Thermomonas sp.]HRO63586.1 flagellar hook capping FlgD N-terminal domain-containing protein [Thermomonas sp.]
MAVDAIGSVLNAQSTETSKQNSIDQESFIKLFLSQLQFQDPLEPVDNREFLAQLAQFSNLEQSRQAAANTEGLLVMQSASQALSLLGRTVSLAGDNTSIDTGTVIAVAFTYSGPELSVQTSSGEVLANIRLSQVTLAK